MADEVRVSVPALYTDEIRAWDPSDALLLVNCIPEDTETTVPRLPDIRLQVVCTVGIGLDPADARVWFTRGTTGTIDLAYDAALGGAQPGYTGTGTFRQSVGFAGPGNDELDLILTPAAAFQSLELVAVHVQARVLGGALQDFYYSFTIGDYDHPEIVSITWLTATRALVKCNEVIADASLYALYGRGNIELAALGHVLLRSEADEAALVLAGMSIEVRGSDEAINNLSSGVISSVAVGSGGTGYLNVLCNVPGTVADDGVDRDDVQPKIIIQRREIRCGINWILLQARLGSEGSGTDVRSAERIQTAYVPIVRRITRVPEEDLSGGALYGQWLFVDFDEPLSLGRLYRWTWRLTDGAGNAGDSTYDFGMPRFGVQEGIDFWTTGILGPKDKEQDLQNGDGSLRRVATILSDAVLLQRYLASRMGYLEDAALCPDEWVPFLLYDRGNPFRFALQTLRLGRRVAENLSDLLRKKGTTEAIELFILRVLGITGWAVSFWLSNHWILGDPVRGRLGHTTSLGPGTLREKNSWVFVTLRDVTDAEEAIIREICLWADPWNMHFLGVIEPSDALYGTVTGGGGYWVLGHSVLGTTTMLGP